MPKQDLKIKGEKTVDVKEIKKKAQLQKAKKPQKTTKEYQKPAARVIIDDESLRPTNIVPVKWNRWIAFGVFLITLIVYMCTQARTMSFWDSGEYATCISILGVPHPPGNPFYILLGRAIVAIFGWAVPHGMIAAFISGLFSALAVMFTYLITIQLTSMMKVKSWEAIFAGLIAAFYTAFSFTFWMNAIEAEVYSGLVFFVNLIFWLTLIWVQKSRDFSHQNFLLLIAYLFFLGFCVHQTALQIAPAMLFIVCYPLLKQGIKSGSFWPKLIVYSIFLLIGYFFFGVIGKQMQIDDLDKMGFALVAFIIVFIELKKVLDRRIWLLGIALVLVGLSSHIYLMVRAAERPFINEGNPSNWKMFQEYVLRKQYGNTSFVQRRGNFFTDQLNYHFLRYFSMQWLNEPFFTKFIGVTSNMLKPVANIFIAFLGVAGAMLQFRKNKHSFWYFLSVILLTTIVMVFVMNLSNAEVRDRDYFFVVAYNMWAIWLGIGALTLVTLWKSKPVRIAVLILMCLIPLSNFITQYRVHDRSQEFIALDYGLNFLNSLEENAIIFTNGDNDTFPLWYAQAVKDPYSKENIYSARDVYPNAESQEAVAKAMEYKNKCLKGIRKDVSVANLSLLNTAWYIRQLRDKEGILFNIPDEQLDDLSIRRVEEPLVIPGPPENPAMGFTMNIPPTAEWRKDEPFYRISDLAVMQIVKDNYGKRPIYFAVTCESFVNFEDYVRNEGMVSRVVSNPGDSMIDPQRLLHNIDVVYNYRSIDNKKVYKDDNMNRLIMNYGSGFVRAANYFVDLGDYPKALEYINKARRFVHEEIKLTEFYTNYYSKTGQWNKLDEFINKTIAPHPEGWKIYLSYILAYTVDKYPDKVLPYLKKGFLLFPDQEYFAHLALGYAQEYRQYDTIKQLLTEVQPKLTYDVSSFISDLTSPPPMDTIQ